MFTNTTMSNESTTSNMNGSVNFDLLWDDSIELQQGVETQVREITYEELKTEFGIDPSIFDEEFDVDQSTGIDPVPQPIDPVQQPLASTSTSSCQFIDMSEEDVGTFIENETNKGTLKKTLCDVRKFETFLKSKKEEKEIYKLEPEKLDQYLATFILAIRKLNGDEYEPTTLRNIVSSIDRKLKRQKYPYQIMDSSSNHFQLGRDALKAKQKSLKKQGKGNKPKRASPLTDEEINILYEKGVLGSDNAKSLLNVLWLNNCIMFGLRGTKENYNLRWGDVQLCSGNDHIEYLEYCSERQTKTRTGEHSNDIRPVNPKIFGTPEDPDRCPVRFYKLYADKRPEDFCGPNDPFYLAPRTVSQRKNDMIWFMKMNVGEKKLGSLMKCMAADAGLDENKRITNHSTRKHLVQKLRDSGIAPTDIMQISGHKNIQSVMNYSAISENKQKECSRILSASRPAAATISSQDQVANNQSKGESRQASNLDKILSDTVTLPVISTNPAEERDNAVISQQNATTIGLNVNTEMNSLFSGATLNIQNFNVYMK